MKGSGYIFWLQRFLIEACEDAVTHAVKYTKFMKLSEEERELLKDEFKVVKYNYKMYVLDLENRLKKLELYDQDKWEKLLRILSIEDSFFAPHHLTTRKHLIIKLFGLEKEFKFLANGENFDASSWPYITCKDCQFRGSLCDFHFNYGRKTGWKDIKEWDINPEKESLEKKPVKVICENCNEEKPYFTLNICEECFDDEVDKYYSDDGVVDEDYEE